MSHASYKKSRAALLLAAVATLGTASVYAQHANDNVDEDGPIVTLSPDGTHDQLPVDRDSQALIADGAPARPAHWLGIQGEPLSSDVLRTHLQLAEGVGVVVDHVVPNSPAEKAGVRKHDVLLDVNGEQITDMTVLQKAVADSEGKPIELKLLRLAKEITLEVTPEKTPENLDVAAGASAGGVEGLSMDEIHRRTMEGAPMEEIQAMLRQLQQNGVAGGMRMLGPGMVINGFGGPGLDLQNMPNNVQVTITRENDGPAKIMVKRGDESWTLQSDDQEALAKLPDDVRPFVEQMLQRGAGGNQAQLGAFNFDFGDANSQMERARQQMEQHMQAARARAEAAQMRAEAAAHGAADAAVDHAQNLNQGLIQRLEALEQHLQQLEQQLDEKSAAGPQDSGDPSGG
jgi:hypothetical protein